MKPQFSIILNCYDRTRVQRHMTQQCIASIFKYTNPPFELIMMDVDPNPYYEMYPEYDKYEFIYVPVHFNLNVYATYNLGASIASTKKLMFIQNDVFVHEGTLNILAHYLNKWDMIFPQQFPITREDIVKIYKVSIKDYEMTELGNRDAGLVGITKKAFKKVGGWDDRYHNLLGEKAFFERCRDAEISWLDHTPALITHIMGANNLSKPESLYNEEMDHDSAVEHGRIQE